MCNLSDHYFALCGHFCERLPTSLCVRAASVPGFSRTGCWSAPTTGMVRIEGELCLNCHRIAVDEATRTRSAVTFTVKPLEEREEKVDHPAIWLKSVGSSSLNPPVTSRHGSTSTSRNVSPTTAARQSRRESLAASRVASKSQSLSQTPIVSRRESRQISGETTTSSSSHYTGDDSFQQLSAPSSPPQPDTPAQSQGK